MLVERVLASRSLHDEPLVETSILYPVMLCATVRRGSSSKTGRSSVWPSAVAVRPGGRAGRGSRDWRWRGYNAS